MIELTSGNLLEANVEALVNTVNCVGAMGKGLALQFRQAEPENYKYYQAACRKGQVQLGEMLVFDKGAAAHPRYIINFPTKRHWRDHSHLEDIASGLAALTHQVERLGIKSIAVPPLGCGNGGLDWKDVRPLIEDAFSSLEQVNVKLYTPEVAPVANRMKIATSRPEMTAGRAVVLELIASYAEAMYRLTMLEVQKLSYFAQAAGQPLRLQFSQQQYGPTLRTSTTYCSTLKVTISGAMEIAPIARRSSSCRGQRKRLRGILRVISWRSKGWQW